MVITEKVMYTYTILQTLQLIETAPSLVAPSFAISNLLPSPSTGGHDLSWPFMCVSIMFTKEAGDLVLFYFIKLKMKNEIRRIIIFMILLSCGTHVHQQQCNHYLHFFVSTFNSSAMHNTALCYRCTSSFESKSLPFDKISCIMQSRTYIRYSSSSPKW